jgi:hypothetical protein
MAVIFQILSNFGPHLVLSAAIFILTYIWYHKSRRQTYDEKDGNITAINRKLSIHNEEGSADDEDSTETDTEEMDPILPDDLQHVPYVSRKMITEAEIIEKSKSYLDFMRERRSVRFYSKKKVPKEVIANIIATAGTSPSGAHTEPWTYVVVLYIYFKYNDFKRKCICSWVLNSANGCTEILKCANGFALGY